MDITILENLGLTKAEITVYLTLLDIGTTKVGEIIKKSNLQSSVVHNATNKLIDKGLITYILDGKIKNYSPANPKILLDFVEEKKKKIEEILPELMKKQERNEVETAEIFEGVKGIKALFSTIIERRKSETELLYFGAKSELREGLKIDNLYRTINLNLNYHGIKSKGLHEIESKGKINNSDLIDVRYTTQILPPDLNIFEDMIAIISWSEKPIGTLIISRQIAEKYKQMWKSIWNNSFS